MLHTEGIVLRSTKYGDSSLILEVLTREVGLQTVLLNSVRKAKSSTGAAVVQLLSIADWVLYYKPNATIHRVSEVRAAHQFQFLPYEVPRMLKGLFCIELLRHCVREPESSESLYQLLKSTLLDLDLPNATNTRCHLVFTVQLMTSLGIQPQGISSAATPWLDLKESVFVAQRPAHDFFMTPELATAYSDLTLATSEAEAPDSFLDQLLLARLLQYYQLHLPYFKGLQSPAIMQLLG